MSKKAKKKNCPKGHRPMFVTDTSSAVFQVSVKELEERAARKQKIFDDFLFYRIAMGYVQER